ncbi:hypothetical protein CHUAL_012980 [Chamberlinius hualienensis]
MNSQLVKHSNVKQLIRLTRNLTKSSNETTQQSQPKPPPPTQNTSGKDKGYEVPEYFQHKTFSYVDFDVTMSKHRLPQPSNKKK